MGVQKEPKQAIKNAPGTWGIFYGLFWYTNLMKLIFPKGFYWGASTSAHQVEGNNHNSWSEWEKKNAERLASEAKDGTDVWKKWESRDMNRFPEMFEKDNYISGDASDHYNKFKEDFDIAKTLSHNTHRFSIEWSRIEPEEGKFDEKEIGHYLDVLHALRERGIEPFVTLWHWPLPVWLEEKGGWENKNIYKYFEKYAKKIADTLGDKITFWITLNEPEVFSTLSYLKGVWPPQKKSYFLYRRVIRNLVKAHKSAYIVIKEKTPQAQVCVAKHNVYFEAYENRVVNRLLKLVSDWWWNDWFLKQIKGFQDVITLNHYHHNRINYGFHKNENEKVSDLGWELYPESLGKMASELRKYKLPIYVTEHGLADADDSRREWFILESLKYLHEAISNGADVRGYLHWSLFDNFEWDKGFWPRFGLVEVDYKTKERTIRSSAQVYKKICESNMLEL